MNNERHIQHKQSIRGKYTAPQFYIPILIFFVIGLFIGFFAKYALSSSGSAFLAEANLDDTTSVCARENGAYQFTNPLLLCNSAQDSASSQYSKLNDQITSFIQNSTTQTYAKNADVETVSVYYRDLNSGKWFGINENEQYSPASLLKVPVMIAYYKQAQTDAGFLTSKLTYTGATDSNTDETFKSQYDIVPGTYTVSDLIKAMIVNSDNNALDLLSQDLNQSILNQLYTYLGVPVDANNNADFMTAMSYSQFFRILYNATYLSKVNSENALELLVSADFPDGLRAGVPASIPIAQKFGERSDQYPDGVVQERDLHDCGIVYYPSNPYLLCVMTKMIVGNTEPAGSGAAQEDFQNLAGIIGGISKIVYQYETQN
jgi:beta-lactamase class A